MTRWKSDKPNRSNHPRDGSMRQIVLPSRLHESDERGHMLALHEFKPLRLEPLSEQGVGRFRRAMSNYLDIQVVEMDFAEIEKRVIASLCDKQSLVSKLRLNTSTGRGTIMRVSSYIIASIATMGIFLYAANYICGIPIVYESWSYQRCVYVSDVDNQYSCDHLPKKYFHIWVK